MFLGVLLYGRERVAPAFHALSGVMVRLGSWLSGYFIVVTDAWMQHPVGYAVGHDGTVKPGQLQNALAAGGRRAPLQSP
jgi:cytochrome d ubiquinol oxidase subunit I